MYKDLVRLFNGEQKEIHVDVYIDSPFVLLSRMDGRKVVSSVDDKRFIMRKADRNKTAIFNIPVSEINNVNISMTEKYMECKMAVHNISYKITVIR